MPDGDINLSIAETACATEKLAHDLYARFAELFDDPDLVGRYGGDEFVVLLPKTESTAAVSGDSQSGFFSAAGGMTVSSSQPQDIPDLRSLRV